MNGEERTKLLARDFVEESVLLFDEEFIAMVKEKKNKSKYHQVSPTVQENVKLRAELWAGSEQVYDNFNECLRTKEWTQFKLNYKGPTPITPDHRQTMRMVDSALECTDEKRDYFISLGNLEKKKAMAYVPRYYIFLWKVVVSATDGSANGYLNDYVL